MTFTQRAFRDALGCFATGIAVVTTVDAAGAPVGVTINSFSSVSLDPPLVLFSLGRRAQSFEAFIGAGRFAVNVLSAEQQELSVRFSRLGSDKFADLAYETWETGCPILDGCLANLDCVTEAMHDGGDHVILVGRVLRLDSRRTGAPLLYFRGRYVRLEA